MGNLNRQEKKLHSRESILYPCRFKILVVKSKIVGLAQPRSQLPAVHPYAHFFWQNVPEMTHLRMRNGGEIIFEELFGVGRQLRWLIKNELVHGC